MRWSVQMRAAVSAGCIVGLSLAAASVLAVELRQRALLREVDGRAQLRLDDVTTLAAKGQAPATLAAAGDDGTIAQIVANGQVVAQSAQLSGDAPIAAFVPAGTGVSMRSLPRVTVAGRGSYRVAARRVRTPTGPVVVYAAAPLEPVHEGVAALVALLLLFGPGVVALVTVTTWWLVRRALAPVESIRREVDEISSHALERRVPEPDTGDQIERLARTMNAMLDRLERAAIRQRAFVSDAAHELRGPLATIRADVEATAAHLPAADLPAVLARIETTSRQLEHLVEDLLVLASADEQQLSPVLEVDLDEIVIRQLETTRPSARVPIRATTIDAIRLSGHPDQLRRVVANLLENAQRYATSSVEVELRRRAGVAELVVHDDGPGVPDELRDRVFDRFARADEARDRQHGGAGLGLAIARRIVEEHGGTISVGDAARGARVVVRLPRPHDDEPVGLNEAADLPIPR